MLGKTKNSQYKLEIHSFLEMAALHYARSRADYEPILPAFSDGMILNLMASVSPITQDQAHYRTKIEDEVYAIVRQNAYFRGRFGDELNKLADFCTTLVKMLAEYLQSLHPDYMIVPICYEQRVLTYALMEK
jgi:hypothetical protein